MSRDRRRADGSRVSAGFHVQNYDIAIDVPDTGANDPRHRDADRRAHRSARHARARPARSRGRARRGERPRPRRSGRRRSPSSSILPARECRRRRRWSKSTTAGGQGRPDRAARQRGPLDVLRRQLAESRAALDSEHRSPERQGDGDVARACAASPERRRERCARLDAAAAGCRAGGARRVGVARVAPDSRRT